MRSSLPALLFGVLAIALAACGSASSGASAKDSAAPVADATPVPEAAPHSPWYVFTNTNELTGEVTTTAINEARRDVDLIVRQRGKKLECYVKTGKFLETVDNMESRALSVKYKFDDGEIVRQVWTISDSNEGIFFPGDPSAFLKKMRKAKRFVIEYKPADVIPETASFDVSQFPDKFSPMESE